MRQNKRNEQQVAEQTIKFLESSGKNPMPTDQEQAFELGRLIRESTDVDLPTTNPELRELLQVQLGSLEDGKVGLPRTASITHPDHNAKRWALAIILLLATGLWATLQMSWSMHETSAARSLKYQSGVESKISDQDDFLVQRHSASSTEATSRHVTEMETDSLDITTSPGPVVRNNPMLPDEGQFSGLAGKPGADVKGDFAVALPPTISYENLSSAVTVPNGGTVLLGGVKRMVENNEGKYGYLVQSLQSGQQTGTDQYSFGLSGQLTDGQRKGFTAGGGGGLGGGGHGRVPGIWNGVVFEPLNLTMYGQNSEQYEPIHENKFTATVGGDAVSTFSIDVDTASYANMRRFINSGQMPPRDSVRIVELINSFSYDYPQPTGDDPFSVNMEFATCPWNSSHKLLRIGLKGKDVDAQERPATNLVFLIDVSGSMTSEDKLPLLKRGFQMMVNKLTENDRITIVTYAGNAGVALEPTNGSETKKINEAIERLTPGGSTHGSAGIELAYELAQKHFIQGGVNKVMLATDGDLNVGITDDDSLVRLIKDKASEGVFLSVLGFGTGNLKDGKLEKLADNGNGLYAYIDSIREAHKVLVEQMSGSLVTIAKDVKIQIEFNPAEVAAYRLIGYENRMLATQDFDNDKKDAGEIGAGHTVTALYELVTTDKKDEILSAPKGMKYQSDDVTKVSQKSDVKVNLSAAAKSGELLTLALRYKKPDENTSKRTEFTVKNDEQSFSSASADFRFAASVASFGMLLRGSQNAGDSNPAMIQEIASAAIGDDKSGYRAEFIDLVRKAGVLCD